MGLEERESLLFLDTWWGGEWGGCPKGEQAWNQDPEANLRLLHRHFSPANDQFHSLEGLTKNGFFSLEFFFLGMGFMQRPSKNE